jgi:hypothetical protein
VPNRASAAREAAIAASGQTPLQFLIEHMRDESLDLSTRLDCATRAAPYVHPRLASVSGGGEGDRPLVVQVLRFSDLPDEVKPD